MQEAAKAKVNKEITRTLVETLYKIDRMSLNLNSISENSMNEGEELQAKL